MKKKKENELNFQSYDYEDETYYLPNIINVKECLECVGENLKSEDDFGINICKLCYCSKCVDEYDCDKISSCDECLLQIDNKKKFDAFNSFLKDNDYETISLKRSNLPITNEELCKAIACFESIEDTIHNYDADFIKKGKFDNLREIKRSLPCLKKFVQYLIER